MTMPQRRRPLNNLTAMFEKACLNNVFGDPNGDVTNKKNIPVHIRPTKQNHLSLAKIEAGPGVDDPTTLSSNQHVVLMTVDQENPDMATLEFTGDNFDLTQFEALMNELKNEKGLTAKIDNEKPQPPLYRGPSYLLEVTEITQEKIDKIVRAWRKAIEPSLQDLGYDIHGP